MSLTQATKITDAVFLLSCIKLQANPSLRKVNVPTSLKIVASENTYKSFLLKSVSVISTMRSYAWEVPNVGIPIQKYAEMDTKSTKKSSIFSKTIQTIHTQVHAYPMHNVDSSACM